MQELKSRERSLSNASMSRSSDEYELHTRCRCTPISRQPEEIQEIRIQDRKED
jgi:hypothetical protein